MTNEKIFNNLSLLVFSILFFFIAILIIPTNFTELPLFSTSDYVGVGFLILSFSLLVGLIVDILFYYVAKSWDPFKKSLQKYPFGYYLSIFLPILLILIWLGYDKLNRESFWSIIISTGLASVLSEIIWTIKKSWFNKNKTKIKK